MARKNRTPKNAESPQRPTDPPRDDRIKAPQIIMGLAGVALTVAGVTLFMLGDVPPATQIHQNSRPWFADVAAARGLNFAHQSGHEEQHYMPEIMSGGVGLIDFDRDGLLDVYFVQAGRVLGATANTPGNQLFRNLGDGRFIDVTRSAGVGDTGYGMGCTCGDFDGDGWTDLYVTNAGPNVLYRNNRDGTFTNVTLQAGVGDPGFGASAAFVDYDHDGDLDLFIVNYVRDGNTRAVACAGAAGLPGYCTPSAFAGPQPDTLYRNNNDGTFTDVTEASGIASRVGNGLGIVCTDINNDNLIDIVVANDLLANHLWINQGNGTFQDEALRRGIAYSGTGVAEAGMGIDAVDIDSQGDVDLFLTHFDAQTNTLYLNHAGMLTDRTNAAGLSTSLPFTGFGTALHDFNNDGLVDAYVANGRVKRGSGLDGGFDGYGEQNQLFEGLLDHTFREVLPRGGTANTLTHTSRAAAFGDLDNDGDVDIVVVNRDAKAYLLDNLAQRENHWITFRVLNTAGSDALGARVEMLVAGQRFIREVRAAYSYCASNDPRIHVGLGKASRIDQVSVTWIDGSVEHFGPMQADQIVELHRGHKP